MPRSLLTALFVFFLAGLTAAIPQHFQHFTEKDGLSSQNVSCILRTSDGFLWVGTDYGLNRYDGYDFKHFLPNNPFDKQTISNEKINALAEDSDGFLWVATNNGLNRYDPKTQVFQTFYHRDKDKNGLPNSMVLQLMADTKHRLWVICDNRNPVVLNTRTLQFYPYDWIGFLDKHLPEKANATYKPIYSISPKNEAELWLNTKFGLFSLDKTAGTFQYYPSTNRTNHTPTDCKRLFYFGSWQDDIWRWDDCSRHWSQIRLPFSEALTGGNRHISGVFRIKKDTYWLLGRQGLLLMEKEQITHLPHQPNDPFSPPSGFLVAFFKEKNGTIWLGGENGLWLYNPQFQHFHYRAIVPQNPPVVDNSFYKVLDAKDGRRYISDIYHHRIFVFDKKNQLTKTIELPVGLTTLLHEDLQGRIWTNSNRKVFTINSDLSLKPFDFASHLLAPHSKATLVAMTQDSKGRYWWADSEDGLLIADAPLKTWTKPDEKQNFIGKNLSTLLADHTRETVWISSEDYGLFRYDEKNDRFTLYRYESENPQHSLAGYSATSITKGIEGKIWIGTRTGGISCFDYDTPLDKAFFTLSTQNGLPSNEITSLTTDTKGRIWATTLKGLVCIFPTDNSIRVFDKNNGLTSEKLDLPISKNTKGDLFLGLKYGYIAFSPDSLLQQHFSKKIIVTSFKIFDDDVLDSININYLSDIRLSWRQNFFAFTFSDVDFTSFPKNQYQYRLVGFDKTWRMTNESRQATYTNVPAGNYWLEVRSGSANQWNDIGFRLAIRIVPPFWQRWWFQGILIAGVLVLFYIFYTNKIYQIKKEEALKTAFNEQLAKVEMAALRSQMNPHFIFNCLSSINRFILVNQPEMASEYLTKFAQLIRLVLDNSQQELIPLPQDLQALRLYIEMEQMRFTNRFVFIEQINADSRLEDLEIPPLLIQPFVENAIWHGLMHQEKEGILQLHISFQKGILKIEIEDNGIGRKKAATYKKHNHQSYATKMTHERLDILRKAYQLEASVEILDLYDDAAPDTALGTKVILTIKTE